MRKRNQLQIAGQRVLDLPFLLTLLTLKMSLISILNHNSMDFLTKTSLCQCRNRQKKTKPLSFFSMIILENIIMRSLGYSGVILLYARSGLRALVQVMSPEDGALTGLDCTLTKDLTKYLA